MINETEIFNDSSELKGQLLLDHSLADYTSLRVGGKAERFYIPAGIQDLSHFIQTLPEADAITYLGLGSNTLIKDTGLKGTVINTHGGLSDLAIVEDVLIRAEAGVPCPKLARFCARNNLTGLEFLATVPGTVGGALAMNAGAYDGETWNFVESVETMNSRGETFIRKVSDFEIGYRSVVGREDEWFVAANFVLKSGRKDLALEKIRKFLNHRAATQPTSENNCGSVFRNPPDEYAGRLIEACGLKNLTVGGASVSQMHANFIVNKGDATASDIILLIDTIRHEVNTKHGILLIPEVRILG